MSNKASWICAALVALALSAGAVRAHDDAAVAKLKAPHGGQLRVAGPLHMELVMARTGTSDADRPIMVHVTDHDGKKIPTAGATGSATLLAGKTRSSVILAPDGDNRLKGLARYVATAELKAVVSIALPGKAAEQARFTPFDAPAR